jgi:hypothetical protein
MATKCSLLLLLLLLLLGLATTLGRGELNAPTAVLLPLLVNSRMYSMHLQTHSSIGFTAQHNKSKIGGTKNCGCLCTDIACLVFTCCGRTCIMYADAL